MMGAAADNTVSLQVPCQLNDTGRHKAMAHCNVGGDTPFLSKSSCQFLEFAFDGALAVFNMFPGMRLNNVGQGESAGAEALQQRRQLVDGLLPAVGIIYTQNHMAQHSDAPGIVPDDFPVKLAHRAVSAMDSCQSTEAFGGEMGVNMELNPAPGPQQAGGHDAHHAVKGIGEMRQIGKA